MPINNINWIIMNINENYAKLFHELYQNKYFKRDVPKTSIDRVRMIQAKMNQSKSYQKLESKNYQLLTFKLSTRQSSFNPSSGRLLRLSTSKREKCESKIISWEEMEDTMNKNGKKSETRNISSHPAQFYRSNRYTIKKYKSNTGTQVDLSTEKNNPNSYSDRNKHFIKSRSCSESLSSQHKKQRQISSYHLCQQGLVRDIDMKQTQKNRKQNIEKQRHPVSGHRSTKYNKIASTTKEIKNKPNHEIEENIQIQPWDMAPDFQFY